MWTNNKWNLVVQPCADRKSIDWWWRAAHSWMVGWNRSVLEGEMVFPGGRGGWSTLAVMAVPFAIMSCVLLHLGRFAWRCCRLPEWWMPLYVAQVRWHPWWDGPTLHHSPASPADPSPRPFAPPSILPFPFRLHMTNGRHEKCALRYLAIFPPSPAFLHPFTWLPLFCHPWPSISPGMLVVNESPMFFLLLPIHTTTGLTHLSWIKLVTYKKHTWRLRF